VARDRGPCSRLFLGHPHDICKLDYGHENAGVPRHVGREHGTTWESAPRGGHVNVVMDTGLPKPPPDIPLAS